MFFVLCLYGCQTSITRVLPVPQYSTYLTFQTSLVRSIRAIIKSIALFVYFLAVLYFPIGRTVANGESEIKCCKTLGKVSCHSPLSSVALQLPFSCPSSLNFQSRWTVFLFHGTVCCQRIVHKNFFSIFRGKRTTHKEVYRLGPRNATTVNRNFWANSKHIANRPSYCLGRDKSNEFVHRWLVLKKLGCCAAEVGSSCDLARSISSSVGACCNEPRHCVPNPSAHCYSTLQFFGIYFIPLLSLRYLR